MYASINPIRAHRDPLPFKVTGTEERAGIDKLGTGLLLEFSPRPEFMPPGLNPVNRYLDLSREYFTDTDPWGWSRTWLSVIKTEVENQGLEVPESWRNHIKTIEVGNSSVDEVAEISTELGAEAQAQLIHAGDVLNRFSRCTEAAGKRY